MVYLGAINRWERRTTTADSLLSLFSFLISQSVNSASERALYTLLAFPAGSLSKQKYIRERASVPSFSLDTRVRARGVYLSGMEHSQRALVQKKDGSERRDVYKIRGIPSDFYWILNPPMFCEFLLASAASSFSRLFSSAVSACVSLFALLC